MQKEALLRQYGNMPLGDLNFKPQLLEFLNLLDLSGLDIVEALRSTFRYLIIPFRSTEN